MNASPSSSSVESCEPARGIPGLVLIDEPDAYLHPHLSQRLIDALTEAVGESGQLIVATHSPSILDRLPASSILRLSHGSAPRLVADEDERLELYRAAGFRASALTQSDLLMIVEGGIRPAATESACA